MTWDGPLERIDEYSWRIPRSYKEGMRVDAAIFASESMIPGLREDNAPEQAANVAFLPGIVGRSLAMPDIHWGYGFPIGGVAAMDVDEGVISPGGIGFDINCGVRLISTPLTIDDVEGRMTELVDAVFTNVPSGLGSKGMQRFSEEDIDDILEGGGRWAVGNGYGIASDLETMEAGGCMASADTSKVSSKAKRRGMPQVGSLGSGNHFVEIDVVDRVHDPEAASAFGLEEGMVTVTIHTGSRGCGHQIATDHLRTMERLVRERGPELPDRQLACAPIQSEEGMGYFGAMSCGANFAWANRQMITHWVREAFADVMGVDRNRMSLVYDVAHNIAKREEHVVDGERRKVLVHRKGATRAFASGHPELPDRYRAIGQPVIIPGDMGTGTYVLVGQQRVMEETFGSTCHGAGRVMSRKAAMRRFDVRGIRDRLRSDGIVLKSSSKEGIIEEAPDAYKDVHEVVSVVSGAGLTRTVARLRPLGVIKG